MGVPSKWGFSVSVIAALALSALAISARADEIRLKDGKKLYGSVVAIEDGMYKVKTDYGYVLVEKDKIALIVPIVTPAKSEPDPAAKKDAPQHSSKPSDEPRPKTEPAVATSSNGNSSATPANASVKTVTPSPSSASTSAKTTAPPSASAASAPAAAPAPPKEPEAPVNREEVTGNLYTNYTHGFRMYKAPSWNLIEEARSALPDAIVAMGTTDESTLMVVGEEKTKDSLDAAASVVEKRLQGVYVNYRRLSQKKMVVGGMPAMEFQYRGKADEHDWSGRLVVISRGKDVLTVLAMTYADSDLIQIQENVIARSISSLDFNVH
ncbi:MAG TPA: hypothetical protein VKB90_15085 [Candidatus Acidoferrum sp.]|nr:hypothetical protein [Candidatus Acidoferrum sp.]